MSQTRRPEESGSVIGSLPCVRRAENSAGDSCGIVSRSAEVLVIRPVLMRSLLAVLLVLAALAPALAQPVAPLPKDEITLERIMADPDWIGNSPEDPYWSDDGSAVYFFKKRLVSE